MGFWALLLPMSWGIGEAAAWLGASFGYAFLTGLTAMAAMACGRLYWWYSQRELKHEARRVLARWRRIPVDPRWDAAMVLLDRIAALSTGDPGLQETARRTATVLFVLYEDLSLIHI